VPGSLPPPPPPPPPQTDLRQRGGLQARAGGAERGQPARAAAGDAWMLKRAGSATLAHADGNSTRCHWDAATGTLPLGPVWGTECVEQAGPTAFVPS
jgi:hypothetical protein